MYHKQIYKKKYIYCIIAPKVQFFILKCELVNFNM